MMNIIPLTKVYSDETGKSPFEGTKTPYSIEYVEWLQFIAYSVQKKKRKSVEKKEVEPWRESFEVYRKETIAAVQQIVNDTERTAELQQIIPDGYNARLTLQKSMREYWLTGDGWRKKKDGNGNPDWWRTCRNIMRMQFNWVRTKDEMVGVKA